jgi:hypothetical protein
VPVDARRSSGGTGSSAPEPLTQGFRSFLRRDPVQDSLDADILIQIRPVNPLSIPDELLIAAFRGKPMVEPRIPVQGYGNGAAVLQIDR